MRPFFSILYTVLYDFYQNWSLISSVILWHVSHVTYVNQLNWIERLFWSGHFLSKNSNSAYFSFVKLSKSSYESSHKNSISLKCYWVKTFLGMILTRKSINPKSKTKLRSAPLPSKKKQFDLKNSFTKVSDDVSMTSERELGGESPKISNWRK